MDLQSLGHAAAMYQHHPRLIEGAIMVVQAEKAYAAGQPIKHEPTPALTLNGVRYYHADEVACAIAEMAKNEAARAREKAEAAANV